MLTVITRRRLLTTIGAAMAGIQRANLRDAPVSRGRMPSGYAFPRHPHPVGGERSGSTIAPDSTTHPGQPIASRRARGLR